EGTVRKIDLQRNEVIVELESDLPKATGTSFSGVFHLTNPYRTTVHPAMAIPEGGDRLRLKLRDDVLVGYLGVANVADHQITSDTELNFHHHYRGTALLDSAQMFIGHVIQSGQKKIIADRLDSKRVTPGDKLWLANIWEGDRV